MAFNIDPNHSQIHLELDHLDGLSLLTARITGLRGPLFWDEASGSLSFDMFADARSVSSALQSLDPLLTSADMFDTASHAMVRLTVPTISEVLRRSTAHGVLTIRDVAVEAELSILSVRTALHQRGHKVIGVRASLSVPRSRFGMAVHKVPTLNDAARFVFNIEATDQGNQ